MDNFLVVHIFTPSGPSYHKDKQQLIKLGTLYKKFLSYFLGQLVKFCSFFINFLIYIYNLLVMKFLPFRLFWFAKRKTFSRT